MTIDFHRRARRMVLGLALLLVAGPVVSAPVKAAEPAGVVTLKELDGAKFDEVLARHRGKIVLVDFWATWCAPCKEMFPKTVALAEKYHRRGLAVISVSFDDAEERAAALEFLTEKKARIENYISQQGLESGEVFQLGDGALPYYRIYDRQGKLVRTFVSGDPRQVFKEQDIDSAIQALLDAKP